MARFLNEKTVWLDEAGCEASGGEGIKVKGGFIQLSLMVITNSPQSSNYTFGLMKVKIMSFSCPFIEPLWSGCTIFGHIK